MITYCGASDVLKSDKQTIVIPVNTVGVMGAGLALWFKLRYPDLFRKYRSGCLSGQFKMGNLWLFKDSDRSYLLLPTKIDWRDKSEIEYVDIGLSKLADTYLSKGITSISIPAIGCGLGGLDFESEVKPLIYKHLDPLPIEVEICTVKRLI
jgi:O-acetyl-ADP-ribose deacetylase (regulator of RNase III)